MRNLLLLLAAFTLIACNRQEPAAPAASTETPPDAAQPAAPPEPPNHHATLASASGSSATGSLELMAHEGAIHVTGTVSGLEPGSEHGFHVHEKGDCSAPDASSAGGHFNPEAQPHGNPDAPPHHAGDIHNIKADAQGSAAVDVQLSGVTLSDGGPGDILGKAVVVHAKPDDYKTQPSGNSGDRIACGVIE